MVQPDEDFALIHQEYLQFVIYDQNEASCFDQLVFYYFMCLYMSNEKPGTTQMTEKITMAEEKFSDNKRL